MLKRMLLPVLFCKTAANSNISFCMCCIKMLPLKLLILQIQIKIAESLVLQVSCLRSCPLAARDGYSRDAKKITLQRSYCECIYSFSGGSQCVLQTKTN